MPDGRPTGYKPMGGLTSVYELYDPREPDMVRYVGKAVDPWKRLRGHIKESKSGRRPVCRWIKQVLEDGVVPAVRVINWCPSENWREVEIAAIEAARSMNPMLLNVADGGDQPYCPKSVRAANGAANARKRQDTPRKRRLWELKQRLMVLVRDGCVREETRQRMRELAAKRPEEFACFASA